MAASTCYPDGISFHRAGMVAVCVQPPQHTATLSFPPEAAVFLESTKGNTSVPAPALLRCRARAHWPCPAQAPPDLQSTPWSLTSLFTEIPAHFYGTQQNRASGEWKTKGRPSPPPVPLPRGVLLPQTEGAGQGVPPRRCPALLLFSGKVLNAGPPDRGYREPRPRVLPLSPELRARLPGTCTRPGRAGVCSPTRGRGVSCHARTARCERALCSSRGTGKRVPGVPRFGEARAGQLCGLSARGSPRRRRVPRWDAVPTRVSPQQQRQHTGNGPGAGPVPPPAPLRPQVNKYTAMEPCPPERGAGLAHGAQRPAGIDTEKAIKEQPFV
ncbi:uncharacterized protein ACIB01_014667 [Guaruba guarouba]